LTSEAAKPWEVRKKISEKEGTIGENNIQSEGVTEKKLEKGDSGES